MAVRTAVLDLILIACYLLFGYGKTFMAFSTLKAVPGQISILEFILILAALNILLIIYSPFFQLIGRNKQLILNQLKKHDKPVKKYALAREVKGLPQSTAYRDIDCLIKAGIIATDEEGRIYAELSSHFLGI